MKYDSEVARIARRFGGVVPVAALESEGLPRYLPKLGLKQGWQRIWPAIYVPSPDPITFQQWVATGLIVFGEASALGGEAALYAMGLTTREPKEILFWVREGKRYRKIDKACPLRPKRDCNGRLDRIPPGLDHTGLVDSLVDYMNGTPNTVDVAGVVIRARKRWPEHANRLIDALARQPRLKHRRLAETLLLAYPAFDSPLEWLFLNDVIEAHGIDAPERQWRCPAGFLRDNAWPSLKAIVELDGDAFHTDKQTVGRDRQKDRVAIANQYVTLRFGYRDVADHACWVAHELKAAIPKLNVSACAAPGCTIRGQVPSGLLAA